MAKGRNLTTSRSERLLGTYGGGFSQGQENGGDHDGQELVEGDVWPNGDDHFPNGSCDAWSARPTSASNESYKDSRQIPLPHADHRRQVGGLSLAFDDSGDSAPPRILHQQRSSPRGRHMATSAPVKVPDWSKIYRVDSVESLHDPEDDDASYADSEWLPPHEYLARENARTRKMAANSVFEGVGRKLKGRDLSRVRDAVWSQTGFYG